MQLSTFGRLLEGHVDELPGLVPSLVSVEDPHVAAISGKAYHANVTFTGSMTDRVQGAVFEISEAELAAADAYERRAAYKRIAARIVSGQRAWVYVDRRSAPAPL